MSTSAPLDRTAVLLTLAAVSADLAAGPARFGCPNEKRFFGRRGAGDAWGSTASDAAEVLVRKVRDVEDKRGGPALKPVNMAALNRDEYRQRINQ